MKRAMGVNLPLAHPRLISTEMVGITVITSLYEHVKPAGMSCTSLSVIRCSNVCLWLQSPASVAYSAIRPALLLPAS